MVFVLKYVYGRFLPVTSLGSAPYLFLYLYIIMYF